MQKIIEDKLKANVERTQSEIGSAVLIDANNGQIKAMANYPTYDPGQFASIEKQEIFKNIAITGQWEPGSVIKPLVMSTAFNENKINPGSTYFDNGSVQVSDRVIRNSENWGAKTMTMKEVITRSLNVGAVYILKSLGGGQINEQARNIWFDYLNKFNFGKKTNIELAGEQPGYIMKPNDPNGAMVTYATMSFGQGMAVTPLQLAASYVPIANGGTYYQPQIIESQTKNGQTVNKEPKIISENLIRKDVSESVKSMLQSSLEINNKSALRAGYVLGAKSGTAEFVDSGGEYEKGIYNGTYVGFISGKKDNYVLLVRLDKPKTSGYASTQAAVTWAQISNEMLNSIAIEPL
jgi:cell division protein FtsI/penicillin-binding protein 2